VVDAQVVIAENIVTIAKEDVDGVVNIVIGNVEEFKMKVVILEPKDSREMQELKELVELVDVDVDGQIMVQDLHLKVE
jgi:hypothetical protein